MEESGENSDLVKHSLIRAFVDSFKGKRVIKNILIANNGLAAVKAIMFHFS